MNDVVASFLNVSLFGNTHVVYSLLLSNCPRQCVRSFCGAAALGTANFAVHYKLMLHLLCAHACTQARMAGSGTLEVGTAAATASADQASDLLAAFLGCDKLNSDQEVVCKLLCCSKASAAVVNVSCSGQLAVDFDPAHSTRFSLSALPARCSFQASWLKSNGHLLRELNCTYMVDEGPWQPKSALAELLPVLADSAPKLQKLSGSIHLSALSPAAQSALGRMTSLTNIQLAIDGAEGV